MLDDKMLDDKLTRRREELLKEIKAASTDDRETIAGLCNEWYGTVFEQYENYLHLARFIAKLKENDPRPEVRRILSDSAQHISKKAEEIAQSLNLFTSYQIEGDIPFYFSQWG